MNAPDTDARIEAPFYITGGTLPVDAASYVPRAADEELYERLLARKFCYILTSRQVGKSSLMVRAAVRLREAGVGVAVTDLTAFGQNLDPEQWYEGLLARIGQQLYLEDELEDFWDDHEGMGPLLRWVEAIRTVVLTQRDTPVVIFVDEIDVVRSLGFSTDEFFAAIRECHNRRAANPEMNRLTFCLIGVATPTDLIEDTRLTPFNIGTRIELTDLTEADAAPLAEGMGGGEVGRRLLKRVFHWTNGHPYLTQKLCAAVAAAGAVTSNADVDRVCEERFLSDRARDMDDNLVYVRERMLRSDVDRAALLDAYGKLYAGKHVRFDDGDRIVTVLFLSGITSGRNGQLHMRNRVYQSVFDRAWIRENMPDAEVRRQKVAARRALLRAGPPAGLVLAIVGTLAIVAHLNAGRAERAEEATAAVSLQRVEALAKSQAETGRVMLRDGDMSGLLHLAAARETAADMPELAHEVAEEWALWHWQMEDRLLQVVGHDSEVTAMAFSPDGRLFVTGAADGTAQMWDAVTGEPHGQRLNHGASVGQAPRWWVPSRTRSLLCFTSDGRLVAIGGEDGQITVWNTDTSERHLPPLQVNGPKLDQMAFDGAGELVAYSQPQGGTWFLSRWDMRNGKVLVDCAPVPVPVENAIGPSGPIGAVLSPDGSVLLAMSHETVAAVDTRTTEVMWRAAVPFRPASGAWSKSLVAFGSVDGFAQVYSREGGLIRSVASEYGVQSISHATAGTF